MSLGAEKRVGGAIRQQVAMSRDGRSRGGEGGEVMNAIASVLQSSYVAEQSAECDADEEMEERGRSRGGRGGFFGDDDEGLMWEMEEEEEEEERRRANMEALAQGLQRY